MADASKIEWTDATWNPGCDHCYAERIVERFKGKGAFANVTLHEDRLEQPLRWRTPRRVFVNSMSDLFHDAVPDDYIAKVFAVMANTPRHTYQLLTKRHGRMRSLLSSLDFKTAVRLASFELDSVILGGPWPLPNVWLGVSVETQQWADIRVPALLGTPAAVRFLSCEPLLGSVDLTRLAAGGTQQPEMVYDALGQRYGVPGRWQAKSSARVDWVIVGGESGPGARPMHPDWARSLRDQCADAKVPYFFKQWGEWAPNGWRGIGNFNPKRELLVGEPLDDAGHREVIERVGKKAAGRELDGRTHDEYPEADRG